MRFRQTYQLWGLKGTVKFALDEFFQGRYFTLFFSIKPEYEDNARHIIRELLKKRGFTVVDESNYNGSKNRGHTELANGNCFLNVADSFHIDPDVDHLIPQILLSGRSKDRKKLKEILKEIESLDFWYDLETRWHP